MGYTKILLSLFVLVLAAFLGYRQLHPVSYVRPDVNAWWGPGGHNALASTAVRPFQIRIDEAAIADLRIRLSNTRFFEPIENARFKYGFNQNYLRDVVAFWKDSYNWREWEEKLNSLPQFTTSVQGLDVHFVHLKAEGNSDRPRTAIMLIHGWPGSFVEFYKAAPMLQAAAADSGLLLDIVVPSIPGYGFSAAPAKQGFETSDCAHVFGVLMERLGYDKYFVQGGDWGSFISYSIALQRPHQVLGLHTNMEAPPTAMANLAVIPLMLLQAVAPSLIMSDEECQFMLRKKGGIASLWDVPEEFGYFLLQSSKPDTVGAALVDSPAGLAAYILEKFSTWTNGTNRNSDTGGLTENFSLDELLTNVMVYWLSGNVASSMRFYKEYYQASPLDNDVVVTVPTGIANYPMEILNVPRIMASLTRPKLVHFSIHKEGGHFPAFQIPAVYSADVLNFIKKVLKTDSAL